MIIAALLPASLFSSAKKIFIASAERNVSMTLEHPLSLD
jgi:hypothetical protein